jgi:hypothetical protein
MDTMITITLTEYEKLVQCKVICSMLRNGCKDMPSYNYIEFAERLLGVRPEAKSEPEPEQET